MDDEIATHYVKHGYATSDEIELSKTATTRIIFRPAVHKGGVRGEVIRQKVGQDGKWVDTNEVDFRRLPADCGVAIDLDTHATETLFKKLEQLYQVQGGGVAYGDQKYVVAKEQEVVRVPNNQVGAVIRELVGRGHSTEIWKQLAAANPSLAHTLAIAQLQIERQDAVRQFALDMKTHSDEEDHWQTYFSRHAWMLQAAFSAAVFKLGDETYVGGKSAKGRNGRGGVATDFLFSDESTKSFAVVEVKTPKTELVGGLYRGEAGSDTEGETYSMSAKLSGAVVQTRNQIAVAIDHFESVLKKTFEEVNRIHPRGVLIVGRSDALTSRQKASFNLFRQGLYSLTVITFDELLRRLEILYELDSSTPRSKP